MLGGLWNDCVILTRQMLTARNRRPSGFTDADGHAAIATELLNLRLLASRLHEGAALLRQLGTFSRHWQEDLPAEAVAAVKRVRRYFSNSSAPLSRLRHTMGFHQDADVARAALDTIGEQELFDYHGEHFATTLYMSAEVLELRALAVLLGTETAREAINILAEDALEVFGDTNIACQAFHSWFLNIHIVPHHPLDLGETITLTNAPEHDAVIVPFFVSFHTINDGSDESTLGAAR